MIAESSAVPNRIRRTYAASRGEPSYTALAAKVFWGPAPARTVAIVACYPGEGTTFVAKSLRDFLSDEGRVGVSLVSADDFLAARDNSLGGYGSQPVRVAGDEIVLVDCPPLFFSASAVRVTPEVDGILLVIEDGARSKAELQRAVSMVEAVEGRVLGAILNKRKYLLPDWLYSLLT